jgi:hypothetical protein
MKRLVTISAAALSALAAGTAWIALAAEDSSPAVVALENAIADGEREVQIIRDEDAIENLIAAYGYYVDKLQWDQLADLFADDGTMELGQRGVYVGKASIRKMLDLLGPQGPRYGWLNNHIQLQPVIDVAPDGASAKIRSRALIQVGEYGGKGAWSEGIYENEAVKRDGVWMFKSVHFFNTFASEYDKGWAKDAGKVPGASDKIPPDRPPSVVFEQYPTAFVPPFHYDSPK